MPCDQCTDPARCDDFGVCQQFRHILPSGSYLRGYGDASADGWTEAGLVCQSCAGDAPGGKCRNPRCVGGPVVREMLPADGVSASGEVIGYWHPRTRAFITPEQFASIKSDVPRIAPEWLPIPPPAGVRVPISPSAGEPSQ